MKTKYFILSIFSFLVLVLLTGCYTSLGTVRHHHVYEEEVEYVEEDGDYGTVNVYHHYYSRPYYRHRFVYYDPYDYWYDEPGIHISIGYVHRPYYHYYGYYGCTYPIWHPVVYRPYYVPVWYYDPGHPKPHYAYKKRDFKKRRDLAGRRYDRRNNRRNNRDGTYNSGKDFVKDNDSRNYGRRTVSRRSGKVIERNDNPVIARRNSTVSKRGADRLPDRSIKEKPIERKRNYSGSRTRNTNKRQYTRETTKKIRSTPITERRVQSRTDYKKKSKSISRSYNSKNTRPKSSSNSVRKSRKYDSDKNKSSRNSSYNRPKTRENKKSTISKPAKRSGSTRSSYSPPKSKPKSSSNSTRKRGRR